MKKRAKKLMLHTETVRVLDETRLQGVAGAFTLDPGRCGTTCWCMDDPGTFSGTCSVDCPTTSLG